MNYKTYLSSNEWKEKRNFFIGFECFFCKRKSNLNLHHRNYDNVGQENPDDFITLCRICHYCIHFDINGGWIKRWQTGSELYIKAKLRNWKLGFCHKQTKVNNYLKRVRSLNERQAMTSQHVFAI